MHGHFFFYKHSGKKRYLMKRKENNLIKVKISCFLDVWKKHYWDYDSKMATKTILSFFVSLLIESYYCCYYVMSIKVIAALYGNLFFLFQQRYLSIILIIIIIILHGVISTIWIQWSRNETNISSKRCFGCFLSII